MCIRDRDILHAIEKTPAEIVFVLPNNKNIIMAAQAASELATREVVVVPTKTVPQGITAMLSFDETQSASENAELMTDSLSGVTTMQITYAARNSDFEGRDIHEGEYLALYNGCLLYTSADAQARRSIAKANLLCHEADEIGRDAAIIIVFSGGDII